MKILRFVNDTPTAHAQWVEVETRPLRGGGQQVIRRWLRHNAIAAWKRCRSQAGRSDAHLTDERIQSMAFSLRHLMMSNNRTFLMKDANSNLFSWKYAGILVGAKLAIAAAIFAVSSAGLLPDWFPHFG